ncbi:MAG: DNA primase [Myxococcales bacterium]|nr:DNA primase [Myxococcales bacterium]MBK7196141.1 DNA primase [Myxococcales bacterium]MBP6846520.1 DNA primase [Kofleriaceae bacterium]
MGLIPDETISEIRARADIVSVIGQHVQLKRAGRNWKGLCPFHGEKSPSFNVSPDKGFFYCFGCHKKGDVFTFVMELQGKSFLEAAETLAAQCGVVIPETTHNPEVARIRGERATMLAINKLATQFFAETLASPRGAAGRAYLDTRAIGGEQRAAFQLGFAPADWHGLADFLAAKRADLEAAVKVGLIARQPKAGGFYDRFRERLVCPIILPGNEVAGFSARLVADAPKDSPVGAKYINSPESPVYKKSRLLFGLAQARDAMRIKGRAVLVEGNFDVISMHQAGYTETVAPLGTALTPEQVELLRRQTNEVILFYDGDRAGRAATRAALSLMLAAEVPVRIAWRSRGDGVRLEGQDPDSLLRGGVDVGASLDHARDGLAHYAMLLWDEARDSASQRGAVLEDLARLVANIKNPNRLEVVASDLSTMLGVRPEAITRAAARAARAGGDAQRPPHAGPSESPGPAPVAAAPRPPQGPIPEHELDLLALVADHPTLLATPQANRAFSLLTDDRLRDMYSAARAGASLAVLAPDRLPPAAIKILLAGSYAQHPKPDAVLDAKVKELEVAAYKRKTIALERQLAQAKNIGDTEEIRRLVLEVMNTRKQVD